MSPRPGWAQHGGLLHVGPPAAVGSAHAQVIERVHRYAWSYDERRADGLAECFTADGVWEGSLAGDTAIGPFQGREAVAGWLGGFWPQQTDQRRHVFTNAVVDELTEDTAAVVAYLVLTAAADGAVRIVTTGCYRMRLRREADGAWRIAHLVAGFDVPF